MGKKAETDFRLNITNIAEAVHYMVSGETLLRERPKADFTSMLTVAMGRT